MYYYRKLPECSSVPCGPARGHTVQWPPCWFVCLHIGLPELSLPCPVPKDVIPLQQKLKRIHYFIVMTMLLKRQGIYCCSFWYGQFFKLNSCIHLVLVLWTSFTNFHRGCGSSGLSDGMFPAWTGEHCSCNPSIIGFGFVKSVQGNKFLQAFHCAICRWQPLCLSLSLGSQFPTVADWFFSLCQGHLNFL